MSNQIRHKREVAWRVFAREFNASKHVINKNEDMIPSYVVSPLGTLANRVFIAGVVTEIENLGSDSEPFWRVRITDPTGVFYLSAGQFQPEVALAISKLKIPSFVCVLGKTRTYTPEGGAMYVTILPESVVETTRETRDLWILDTVKKTQERLNCMSEALKNDSPSEEWLIDMGFKQVVAHGVMKALNLYDEIPIDYYREMLMDPLRTLAERDDDFLTSGAAAFGQRAVSEEENTLRKEILKIIEDRDHDGEGAIYQDLMELVEAAKIDRNEAEDIITKLLDDGHLFEPVLGRLKRA